MQRRPRLSKLSYLIRFSHPMPPICAIHIRSDNIEFDPERNPLEQKTKLKSPKNFRISYFRERRRGFRSFYSRENVMHVDLDTLTPFGRDLADWYVRVNLKRADREL